MVIVINKNLLISFLIVVLLFSFSQAYAYTEITDCTQITSPGEYKLTQDIIDTDVSVCIDIQSDNVVFDCQGHILDQVYLPPDWFGIGINIGSRSNVTIKNCVFGDWFFQGIYSYQSSNITILNCSFTFGSDFSQGESIRFSNTYNCQVDNITSYRLLDIRDLTQSCYLSNLYISGEYSGIYVSDSSNIVMNKLIVSSISFEIENSDHINVTNSYINATYDGIDLSTVGFSVFNNIEIYGVDRETFYGTIRANYGLFIESSNFNNFTNITIRNFKHEGIWLGRWSVDNTFINVSISDIVGGEGIGVYVWRESDGNYFKGLTIRNTSYAGIFLDYLPAGNVFEDFTISDIADSGIWFTQVQYTNEFRNGRIENIHNNGIRLEDAANQVFHNIIIKNSGNCGISLWDSGYNLFYNNIFMNRNNTCFEGNIYPNYWNTTLKRGKNILGGPFIGGNFWGRSDGKSILDELKYAIKDGIYDHPYDLLCDGSNVDYHPLAMYVVPSLPIGLGATARAIAQINPLAVLIFVLMPIIIGEFLIRNFEEIRANEPLKAIMRLLIIITALALFALAF
jgi:parallel beta-helix repeat protein